MLAWTCNSADSTVELLGACGTCLLSRGDEATDKSFMDTTGTVSSVFGGTQSARIVPMEPGTDDDPHEAFLRVWSDSESMYACLVLQIRKQKPRAHSRSEAEYYAAASAARETMLIREVFLFMGLEVRT